MTSCRIVLVEDQRNDRTDLAEGLREEYTHEVKEFRDLRTLEQADQDGSLQDWGSRHLQLLVILDIMLAEDLDENAPRSEEEPLENVADEKTHVDDELGIRIAARIREGHFQDSIPTDVPILFFTARMRKRVSELVEKTMPEVGLWGCLEKPAFLEDVQEKICELTE